MLKILTHKPTSPLYFSLKVIGIQPLGKELLKQLFSGSALCPFLYTEAAQNSPSRCLSPLWSWEKTLLPAASVSQLGNRRVTKSRQMLQGRLYQEEAPFPGQLELH